MLGAVGGGGRPWRGRAAVKPRCSRLPPGQPSQSFRWNQIKSAAATPWPGNYPSVPPRGREATRGVRHTDPPPRAACVIGPSICCLNSAEMFYIFLRTCGRRCSNFWPLLACCVPL